MSLPDAWVDRIFNKLSVVYGHQFLSRWDGMPIEAVKADWAHELSGYQQSPDAVGYALQHLPLRPPNVLEFRELCRSAPRTVAPSLPPPSPGTYTPEIARKYLAEARALLRGIKR